MSLPPHAKDLRKGRHSEPGGVYLLTWTTEQRWPWFANCRLGRQVVQSLRRVHERRMAESLAFVVMPDHVHWLVSLGDAPLAEVMRQVKSHSGFHVKQAILNEQPKFNGLVWQTGYHDHALRAEEDLLEVARYLVMNPVRAGLVRSVREYPLWDARWL